MLIIGTQIDIVDTSIEMEIGIPAIGTNVLHNVVVVRTELL